MFAREWKKARRAEAATPTPSVNNIESIADEECVTLGYYEANEEQIEEQAEEESQGELEKNACYGGIMFLREWKKTRRSVASTPTPSTGHLCLKNIDQFGLGLRLKHYYYFLRSLHRPPPRRPVTGQDRTMPACPHLPPAVRRLL